MRKPDHIDGAMWKRFLAFEKFDRLKTQESCVFLFLVQFEADIDKKRT